MEVLIGTRGSRLALAQAGYVRDVLRDACPRHSFDLRVITTKGDRITDRPLDEIGGKGLFVREIEEQLLAGGIQLAVHSMKDMPVFPAEGLVFTRTWKREDARDALILREKRSLAELPFGAVIGTGSIRRQTLLRRLRPDLRLVGIRGNIDTRLRRMEEDRLDGIVLAAAGLHRLGMRERITQYLSYEQMIPSPAQGVLALEVREDAFELRRLLDQFAHEESECTAAAEREFLRLCGGDCHMPVGAVCERMPEGRYRLRAVSGAAGGEPLSFVCAEGTDAMETAREAALRLAADMESGKSGKVFLVGAGPGDPGLITVRGRELLRQADCVIYDRLVPGELLQETGHGCEMVYVGKENHHHTMGQEEINAWMIQRAVEGKKVVRLKGGDPFVFGRGGEEALALLERGIGVEVVPGVTSAVAGAACAGIPVTHRGVAGGFHVVAAHDQDGQLADIDFKGLVSSGDTILFLMGLSKLEEIIRGLREAGMSEQMDVAVISHAAWQDQRVCQGVLSDIVAKVRAEGLTSPALILAGPVVRLRKQLAGLQREKRNPVCLIPRVGAEVTGLVLQLRKRGICAREVQVGEIVYRDWMSGGSERPDWLLFTSRHGVEGFFYGIQRAGLDVRFFTGTRIAAIGAKTAAALLHYGLQPDQVPERADSSSLAGMMREILRRDDRVWYLRAEGAGSVLVEELSGLCRLSEKIVYENQRVEVRIPDWSYDAVAFTCASSVRRLYEAGYPLEKSLLYSIGPGCTRQLQQLGMPQIIQSDQASCEALAEKIGTTLPDPVSSGCHTGRGEG